MSSRPSAEAAERANERNAADLSTEPTMLSSAGSILGGLLGGRTSRGGLLGQLGRAAGRSGKTSAAGTRVDAAKNKLGRLQDEREEIEAELQEDLTEIDVRWAARARQIDTLTVPLERTDVKVTQLTLAWIPVS